MPSTKPAEQVTNYIITDSANPSSTIPESNDNDNWDTNLYCLTAYIGSWHGAKLTYDPEVDGKELARAFRNIAGVERCSVFALNLLQLVPGGHVKRFVIWTSSTKIYNKTRLYMPGGIAMPSTKPTEQVTNYIIMDSTDPSSTMPESNDNDNWDTNLYCLTAYMGSWHGAKLTYEDPSEYPHVLDIGEKEIEMGGVKFPDMDRIITYRENAEW